MKSKLLGPLLAISIYSPQAYSNQTTHDLRTLIQTASSWQEEAVFPQTDNNSLYCYVEVNPYNSEDDRINVYSKANAKKLLVNPSEFSVERKRYHSEIATLEASLIDCISEDQELLREIISSYSHIPTIDDSDVLPELALKRLEHVNNDNLINIYLSSNSDRVKSEVLVRLEENGFLESKCSDFTYFEDFAFLVNDLSYSYRSSKTDRHTKNTE